MTILRNGNIGIGNNVLVPTHIMDFGGRPRIRHNNATAGLFLDNSTNNPEGFIGMKTDKQVGFFLNGAWRMWVDDENRVWTPIAQLGFVASDKRLKTNITPLTKSLSIISQIGVYQYNWIDSKMGKDLQNGVIAQELEKILPALVSTGESGYKAVNYIGLIPHLIEAVKELDQKTSEIAELKKELTEVKQLNKRMTEMEASLKTLLTRNTSAISKPYTK